MSQSPFPWPDNARRAPLQVEMHIDDLNCIINYSGDLLWVSGFSTAGMVDGHGVTISKPIKISGTKTYTTVLGASRTVWVVEPLE